MFRANKVITHGLRFLGRQDQDFFQALSKRGNPFLLRLPADAALFFHFDAEVVQIDAHGIEHRDGHAFAQGNQTQQQMFGPDIVVIKAFRLFLSQHQRVFGARREIFHSGIKIIEFIGHGFYAPARLVLKKNASTYSNKKTSLLQAGVKFL